jgi:DNA-binding MurR/RpiR family transcriptional regulator
MSCLTKLDQLFSSLSPSDQKLASVIQQDPQRVQQLSSQELAQLANVSQSSVIKFAQKLGYKGFTELRLALAAENKVPSRDEIRLHNQIGSQDPLTTVAQKLLADNIRALESTLKLNDEDSLQKAVGMLIGARRIFITGLGSSGLVARDLAIKLLKIGLNVQTEADAHVQLTIAHTLGPEDLLIAISFSGQRRETNLAASEARVAGCPVLAITGLQPNPLHNIASHCLFNTGDELAIRSSAITTRTTQLALTDLLFIAMVQHDVGGARQRILHSEELVQQLK